MHRIFVQFAGKIHFKNRISTYTNHVVLLIPFYILLLCCNGLNSYSFNASDFAYHLEQAQLLFFILVIARLSQSKQGVRPSLQILQKCEGISSKIWKFPSSSLRTITWTVQHNGFKNINAYARKVKHLLRKLTTLTTVYV